MEVLNTALVALLLLLLGDFISTFLYHVPEHVFGKFHSAVHHSKNRSFIRYAVLTKNPLVLITGFFSAFPYLIFVPCFWRISPTGTLLGLLLGELHALWRHVSLASWKTPKLIKHVCNLLCLITPERHWLHHQNPNVAYGDIFTFYDKPARVWLRVLLSVKKKLKQQVT